MDGPYREEIEKLEALYAENPEGRVFTHLAEAYRKAGELQRANAIIEGGLRRHAEYSSAHVVLGRVRLDLGDREGAMHAFERVIELDPHNLVALRALGELTRHEGRHEEALKYYRDLLVLDPSDEEASGYVSARRYGPPETGPTAPRTKPPAPAGGEWWSPVEPEPEMVEESAAPGVGDGPAHEPAVDAEAETVSRAPAEQEPVFGGTTSEDLDAWDRVLAATGPESSAPSAQLDSATEPPAAAEPGAPSEESGPTSEPALSAGEQERADEQERLDERTPPGEPSATEEAAPPEGETREVQPPPTSEPVFAAGEAAFVDRDDAADEAPEDTALIGEPPSSREDGQTVDLDENLDWLWSAEITTYDEDETDAEIAPASPGPTYAEREPEPDDRLEPLHGVGHEPDEGAVEIEPEIEPEPEPEIESEAEETPAREMFTETMAELYVQQGFHERAVEVYRELIRKRPYDERLEARLREAEARAAEAVETGEIDLEGGAPSWRPAWAEGEPTRDAPVAEDARVEEVESVWTGRSGAMEEEASLYTWEGDVGGGEASGEETRSIGEYFASLLDWGGGSPAIVSGSTSLPPPLGPPDAEERTERSGSAAPTAPPIPLEPSGEMEPSGDEDDDIEMFRAWLQSLKY